MKVRFATFTFVVIFSLLATCAYSQKRPKRLVEALDTLDLVIGNTEQYVDARRDVLRSIDAESVGKPHDALYYKKVADAYSGFNADSARVYYGKGARAAKAEENLALQHNLLMDYASQMSKVAMFADAFAILDSISVDKLDRGNAIKYYSAVSQVRIDASEYAATTEIKEDHLENAVKALRILANYFPEGSVARRMTDAQIHYFTGDEPLALGELNEVFDQIPPDHPSYAILAAMLAQYYGKNPEYHFEYLYYLTVSAIADVKVANGEALSLSLLGNEMFKDGDLERAFHYLTASGEALARSQSRILIAKANPSLASLAKALHERQRSRAYTIALVGLAFALIISFLLWVIYKMRRDSRREEDANRRLKDSISARDSYINQLLSLCAVYVEGLEDFNRLVGRKLKANQVQDLYKMIESGKMLQDQTERFFNVFDAAMLKLFPNFVEQVNELLAPDKQVAQPAPGKLNPELRILAFMRLGVTDSTRISKFLGLSLNTVYTYRNRMKSRALNRETFEDSILKIGEMA